MARDFVGVVTPGMWIGSNDFGGRTGTSANSNVVDCKEKKTSVSLFDKTTLETIFVRKYELV